jgi:hypothetical protein
MAKGKHSTALFEVIHSAREPGRVAQRLNTPKWWFKSRHRSGKTTGETETTKRAAAVQHPEPAVETRRPESRYVEKRSRIEAEHDGRSSAVRVGFDRARKEFALRFQYTTALVGGFALLAVVGVAYVIGRHMTNGPQSASAAEQQTTVQQLMQQPANPEVTNVRQRTQLAAAPQNSAAPKQTVLSNANTTPTRTVVTSLVPASAVTDLPRTVRLNYVVIATYPVEEQPKAEAARAYFTKAGIPCTLEKCGWAPRMISLTGTAGFAHVKDKDFASYNANIVKIAKTMKTSQFDKPSPGIYCWKGEPIDKPFTDN